MTHHHLHSSPETCHWGFFEAKLKPVLTIASGDEVTVDTISGGPEVVPDPKKFHVPPELAQVHATNERMVPGHILTGPIAVAGAEPGDVLEVEILDVKLRQDWGYNMIRPLAGTLPDDFHETRLINIPLDATRMVGRLPWGLDPPLKPFFGVMGVAPPPGLGPHHLADPARDGRQSGQQGADPGRQTLSAGVRARRAILLRRRPWRAGRRRSLRHRDRDRAAGTVQADAAQGFAARLPARRDARSLHDHGDGSRPRPMRSPGATRHDRAARRKAQSVARGCLHALQPRCGP